MLVLVESQMNYANNVFVSNRLFISYLNIMPLNLRSSVWSFFFATSPLTSMETCCLTLR